AFHDYKAGRPSCTQGTRVEILKNITKWADTSESKVYWMGGMAGTGKSTIAKTLCETFEAEKQILGGAFFCSRQVPSCRDYTKIIPTIAYQLAHYSRTFAEALTKELQKDSRLADKETKKQMKLLLLGPWKEAANISELTGKTPIVVIDALDECEDVQLVLEPLLYAITNNDILGLKFVFTSRPDQPVYKHLIVAPHDSRIFLHDVEKDLVESDISRFLAETLKGYDFVTQEHILQLAKLSGKLFIFAATIVKWITRGNNSFEKQRLDDVLNLQPDPSQTKELDNLYTVIVEKAIAPGGGKIPNKERKALLKVLHSVITVRSPASGEVIAALANVAPQQAHAFIAALGSVLYVGKTEAVYVFHTSFSDFLMRKQFKKQYKDLHCDSHLQHQFLGNSCFSIMQRELKFNMLGLPSSFLKDTQVDNIESDIDVRMTQSLVYACKSWGYHLGKATRNAEITTAFTQFLNQQIIYWVEVMSVLRVSKSEKEAVNDTLLQQIIRCVKAAVETFLLSPVNSVTPHWYLSILPFWQRDIAAIQYGLKMGTMVKRQMEKPILGVWHAESKVNSIGVSGNGERIVSGCYDTAVRVWNARTGAPIGEPLQGHTNLVWSVTFSPDGKRIVSGSEDNTVRIWDAETRALIGDPLQGHTNSVLSVAFSPNGKQIVSSSWDKTVRIWNAETGAPIGEPLQGHTQSVWSAAFSPDGKRVVSCSLDETVRIWDAETGAPIGRPFHGHTQSVWSVAFSPDGKRIISGSLDKTVRIWNAETGIPIGDPLQGHTDSVRSVAFSLDGKRIVSGSLDETVRIWDGETGTPIGDSLQGHTDAVLSVTFSPDGKRLISGSLDETIRIWNAEIEDTIIDLLHGHTDSVQSVAFSPDGKRILSGSLDKTVRIWNAEIGTPVGDPLQGHTDTVLSVAFSPDGTRIVSGSDDKTIRIWNAETGAPIGIPLQTHNDAVWSVVVSPDGKKIISGSEDKTIRIWNAETGAPIGDPLQGHTHSVQSVAFSPDGKMIVSGSLDWTVRIWNAETGAPIGDPLHGHTHSVLSVAFSPDGRRIVSSSLDETVMVWNVETGAAIGEPLQGHTDPVLSVTFSPDGMRIVSCSLDHTVRIWNAETGAPIGHPFHGHTQSVLSVAFSPDGKRIVSGSEDSTVRIW
ncbi:hypothetical protein GYMLUDRAFT_102638, partial [Collybiopsis luxurians FD-317 M1]